MTEFKVVVSDPKAGNAPVVKVKVKGVGNISYDQAEKEGRRLPKAKANPKLIEKLNPDLKIVTVRREVEGKKLKVTLLLEPDDSVPEDEIHCSAELASEKLGGNEVEAEAFRAKAWQITVSGDKAAKLIGLKIGDEFDGSVVGLPGVTLKIRGGSDNSGFPMRPDIPGGAKRRVLLSGPPGFHPKEKGERRRKTVRGNTITDEIVQINTVIVWR